MSETLTLSYPASRSLGRSNRPLHVAVSAVLIWSLFTLWFSLHDHPLYGPDEARYARASQTMAKTGDYLVPYFQERARLQKPPLVYWLQAASMRLFGVDEFAARFPSVLFTLLTVVMTGWMGFRIRDLTMGFIAAVALLLTPLTMVVGRLAIIDPILSFFWNAALFAGFMAFQIGPAGGVRGRGRRQALKVSARPGHGTKPCRSGDRFSAVRPLPWWCMWGALSMGLLAKGPIALLPLLVVAFWVVATGQVRRVPWRLLPAWFALALGPLLAWVVMIVIKHPEAVTVWWKEIVDRAAGTGDHPAPFWFYLPVMICGLFPVIVLAPTWGWHYRLRDVRLAIRRRSVTAFLGFAVLLPLIVMSLISGKLATYVLPLAPAAALLAAWECRRWLDAPESSAAAPPRTRRRRMIADGVGSAAWAMFGAWLVMAVFAFIPALQAKVRISPHVAQALPGMVLPVVAAPVLALAAAALWKQPSRRRWSLLLLAASFNFMWCWIIEEVEDDLTIPTGNPTLIERIARSVDHRPFALSTFGAQDLTLSFYLDREVPTQRSVAHPPIRPGGPGERWVIITDSEDWHALTEHQPAFTATFETLFEWSRPRDHLLIMVQRVAHAGSEPGQGGAVRVSGRDPASAPSHF